MAFLSFTCGEMALGDCSGTENSFSLLLRVRLFYYVYMALNFLFILANKYAHFTIPCALRKPALDTSKVLSTFFIMEQFNFKKKEENHLNSLAQRQFN